MLSNLGNPGMGVSCLVLSRGLNRWKGGKSLGRQLTGYERLVFAEAMDGMKRGGLGFNRRPRRRGR